MQRAVTPDEMGSIALPTYQDVFSKVEKPFDNINSRLFLMNKKGLKGHFHDLRTLAAIDN